MSHMKSNKRLTAFEIGHRIRQGKTFKVGSERERKAALDAARFAGVEITTRVSDTGGFNVYFLNPKII